MTVFNQAYYSISPAIAEFIADHISAALIARALIYPLLITLHLAGLAFDFFQDPELAIICAGMLASSLIGLVYLLPIIVLVRRFVSRSCPAK